MGIAMADMRLGHIAATYYVRMRTSCALVHSPLMRRKACRAGRTAVAIACHDVVNPSS